MLISSIHNPLIKQVISLREPKGRSATALTIVDGEREIRRAISSGVTIETVIHCQPGFDPKHLKRATVIEVAPKIFEKVSYGQRDHGVLALARLVPKVIKDLKLPSNPLVVVIEALEKPGNLGAILRTCDAAGVHAVLVCDPKTDIYNPNVIRASTGAVFTVPTVVGPQDEVLGFLKKRGLQILGTFPSAQRSYVQADLRGALAVVLGSEDQGLSPFWQKNCDLKVRVPMQGKTDSLNVSVTAAVVLFESLRQKGLLR